MPKGINSMKYIVMDKEGNEISEVLASTEEEALMLAKKANPNADSVQIVLHEHGNHN
jgi:hypothetical protein